ncbi:diphthine synthase [Candidatus Pacearchaeota archaeon]|jgi:diphthine synthase|nr:diphthine synthase [Candidatus Pacearchaeota archaeon]
MLYLIGLGLNENGISLEGISALKKCGKVYLENYTVDFPYSLAELEKVIKKKIISLNRDEVESDRIVREAKKENVALLIYGSPLTATTHITIIEDAKKQKVKYHVIYGASIFDAIAETGLQIYKFGKIASIPKWQKNFTPNSFIEIVKENKKINSHSLLLMDIGLDLKDALEELEKSAKDFDLKLEKILVCSRLGTDDKKIIYDEIKDLKNKVVKKPYCLIIPGKLHIVEEEVLNSF